VVHGRDLVGVRLAARGAAVGSEEEVKGPVQVRREAVSLVEVKEPTRLVAGLLEKLATGTYLGSLPFLRGPSGEGVDNGPYPMAVFPSEHDAAIRRDGEDRRRHPEVNSDPAPVGPARKLDVVLGNRGPAFAKPPRLQDLRGRIHSKSCPGAKPSGYKIPTLFRTARFTRKTIIISSQTAEGRIPLKFWKKDKVEAKPAPKPQPKPTPKPEPTSAGAKAEPAVGPEKGTAASPGTVAVTLPKPQTPTSPTGPVEAIPAAHHSLVELGLTTPATMGIFERRVAAYPEGAAAFAKDYQERPYRAVTRVLVDWLAVRASTEFDPPKLLGEVNLRLSSFGLAAELKELTWLDQELGLRKGRVLLGGREKIVRFKDPRDFMKGINDLIAPRRAVFLELETWSDEFAFILVREPRWDRLVASEAVVVKAPQTASGGQCGECGAPVGKYWHDCLTCGAVFERE